VVIGAGLLWIILVIILVILVLGFFFGRGRW
jgi:flagellar basal body-associated protein FliL